MEKIISVNNLVKNFDDLQIESEICGKRVCSCEAIVELD